MWWCNGGGGAGVSGSVVDGNELGKGGCVRGGGASTRGGGLSSDGGGVVWLVVLV